MRTLSYVNGSDELSDKFKTDFKFVIDFVKKNKDVFLGIRNNSINLYANGGSFFKLWKSRQTYKASINAGDEKTQKGYYKKIKPEVMKKLKSVNNQELTLENIEIWKGILKDLKDAVADYMLKHDRGTKEGSSTEKVLQQKLALAFNNSNSSYFTYDIEYNIEGLNDYYQFKDGTPDIERSAHTLGRMDNMVIHINNNKVKFYFFELKEGKSAINSTNYRSKSTSKKYDSFGNGVIGHVNLYMTIIDYIKRNKTYYSKYAQDYNKNKGNKKPESFDIRDILMTEVKYIMKFYQDFDLINNENYKNIDYDNLVFDDVELVFYLGGYAKNFTKLEDNLVGKAADSVVNLINNNPMKYKYIGKDEIYNFKYYKDEKNYYEERELKDLDISNYNEVKVEIQNNKVNFTIS